ncbi:MAG: helix-turn-helix domain-containing protein [Candidatus Methylacidiphilales bacterium]|nr:AraC family transcriptional regulator [Candidatus Methylacidiphilales bacterium]
MIAPLDLLDRILNTPPRIIFTCRDTYTGHSVKAERIVSHRYIRIVRGRLTYRVDSEEASLGEGTILFVSKGSMREWKVPKGEFCENLWCEFDTPGLKPDPHALYYADDSRKALEKAALTRLLKLWKFPKHLRSREHGDPAMPRETALLMEGELKASMARFWTSAKAWASVAVPASDQDAESRAHTSVHAALAWMEENYRKPDAQQQLFKEVIGLSPNHFRLLFTRQVGASVTQHLHRLRMREAMNLLRYTSLSIKEIAANIGFNDPLYFSRRFHEHWDIAPTGLRK